jgi:hypothetical protein
MRVYSNSYISSFNINKKHEGFNSGKTIIVKSLVLIIKSGVLNESVIFGTDLKITMGLHKLGNISTIFKNKFFEKHFSFFAGLNRRLIKKTKNTNNL